MSRVVFLTSSPSGPLDGSRMVDGLDHMNQFVENLHRYWPENARCLMITAAPDEAERNDEMTAFFGNAVKRADLTWSVFELWDRRTLDFSKEALHSYDVIFLGGGHVPTQNRFFEEIGLREKIQDFEGIIIGISAGTMNRAENINSLTWNHFQKESEEEMDTALRSSLFLPFLLEGMESVRCSPGRKRHQGSHILEGYSFSFFHS